MVFRIRCCEGCCNGLQSFFFRRRAGGQRASSRAAVLRDSGVPLRLAGAIASAIAVVLEGAGSLLWGVYRWLAVVFSHARWRSTGAIASSGFA